MKAVGFGACALGLVCSLALVIGAPKKSPKVKGIYSGLMTQVATPFAADGDVSDLLCAVGDYPVEVTARKKGKKRLVIGEFKTKGQNGRKFNVKNLELDTDGSESQHLSMVFKVTKKGAIKVKATETIEFGDGSGCKIKTTGILKR